MLSEYKQWYASCSSQTSLGALASPEADMALRDTIRLERQAAAALNSASANEQVLLWGWVDTEIHLRKKRGKSDLKWVVVTEVMQEGKKQSSKCSTKQILSIWEEVEKTRNDRSLPLFKIDLSCCKIQLPKAKRKDFRGALKISVPDAGATQHGNQVAGIKGSNSVPTIAQAAAAKAAQKAAARNVLEKIVLGFPNSVEFRSWHGILGGDMEGEAVITGSDVVLSIQAATVVQRHFRGFLVRKRQQALKARGHYS